MRRCCCLICREDGSEWEKIKTAARFLRGGFFLTMRWQKTPFGRMAFPGLTAGALEFVHEPG